MMIISWLLGYDIDSLLQLENLQKKMKVGFKSTDGSVNTISNLLDFFKTKERNLAHLRLIETSL